MKFVTYVGGSQKPRVGLLENGDVIDVGFDGDMVAFIAAGAPFGKRTPVGTAKLLAPLRPRSMRDFLTFEGHLNNALTRLGRPIPREWYEVPAYYKGMPDTVIGPDEEIPWPAYTQRLDLTADELDPYTVHMVVRVNGEVWGEDTSAHMHHTFADLIAYASQAQTLYPGDVFGSGTAAGGSGLELDRFLKEGDVIEMEIEGIGLLRNRVGQKGA